MPWFYFYFPISKARAVFNSIFSAEGKGNFHVWKNGTPSHLRTRLPSNTCLLQLKPVQTESPDLEPLFKCSTILQYLFPTCLTAMIAWECSSQGKLCLGPDMAQLTVANAHSESHLAPEALEFKHALPFRLLGLAKASKRKKQILFIFTVICYEAR